MLKFTLSPLSCTGSKSSVSITENSNILQKQQLCLGEQLNQDCIAPWKQQFIWRSNNCSWEATIFAKSNKCQSQRDYFEVSASPSVRQMWSKPGQRNRRKVSPMQSKRRCELNISAIVLPFLQLSWNEDEHKSRYDNLWKSTSLAGMRFFSTSTCQHALVDFGVFATERDTPSQAARQDTHTP